MIYKKANITISFSWIFMIVIGSFFIILAYNVVGKYQENEQIKYEMDVRNAFRSVLNNVGQTTGYEENTLETSETLISIFRDTKAEISCYDIDLPLLSINGKENSVDFLDNYPTFMTKIDEGKVPFVYLAVENFRAPFKVTNLLAIVSKKNLIVFDEESEITDILRDKFGKGSYKESLNFMFDDFGNLELSTYQEKADEENIETIMFVSDEGKPLTGFNLDELDVTAYRLEVEDSTLGDFDYGNLHYYDIEGGPHTYEFLDFKDKTLGLKPVSMITMGVFSSPEAYSCAQNLIIKSTKRVLEFYINKTTYMEELASENVICSESLVNYDAGTGEIDGTYQVQKYENLNVELKKALELLEDERFNNLEDLYSIIEKIYESSVTLRDKSCEPIY